MFCESSLLYGSGLFQTFQSCGLLTKLLNKQEMRWQKVAPFVSAVICAMSLSFSLVDFQTFLQWLCIFHLWQWHTHLGGSLLSGAHQDAFAFTLHCYVVMCVPDYLQRFFEWSDHRASLRYIGSKRCPLQIKSPRMNVSTWCELGCITLSMFSF